MQCTECLQEDKKTQLLGEMLWKYCHREKTQWLITASIERLQWDLKTGQTLSGGLIVDCNYMSACWSGSVRKGSTHKSYAFRLQEHGAQARFVFCLLFNKRDLFSLSIPNSEEWTAFNLGPLPSHSVTLIFYSRCRPLHLDSYKNPSCCLCKHFSWVSQSHRASCICCK